jgi:Uma2 family endonuclease
MNLPATEKKKYTYQDYLKFSNDVRYEIIEGNLIIVPAPNSSHQNISRNIELLICDYIYKNNLGEVFHAPYDVILDNNNIIQPDILYISREQFGNIKDGGGFFGSPEIVIEIISPSSKSRDTYQKKDLYESFNIKEYWIVDPANKTMEIFTLDEKSKYYLFSEGYLGEGGNSSLNSNILKDLEINLSVVFAKRY